MLNKGMNQMMWCKQVASSLIHDPRHRRIPNLHLMLIVKWLQNILSSSHSLNAWDFFGEVQIYARFFETSFNSDEFLLQIKAYIQTKRKCILNLYRLYQFCSKIQLLSEYIIRKQNDKLNLSFHSEFFLFFESQEALWNCRIRFSKV